MTSSFQSGCQTTLRAVFQSALRVRGCPGGNVVFIAKQITFTDGRETEILFDWMVYNNDQNRIHGLGGTVNSSDDAVGLIEFKSRLYKLSEEFDVDADQVFWFSVWNNATGEWNPVGLSENRFFSATTITSGILFNGLLFLGGNWVDKVADPDEFHPLATWDGSTFNFYPVTPGFFEDPIILNIFRGRLYMQIRIFPNDSTFIKVLNGNIWEAVDTTSQLPFPSSSTIQTAVYKDLFYILMPNSTLWTWDETTLVEITPANNGTLTNLVVYKDFLIVAGVFTSIDGKTIENLANFDDTEYTQFGLPETGAPNSILPRIADIIVDPNTDTLFAIQIANTGAFNVAEEPLVPGGLIFFSDALRTWQPTDTTDDQSWNNTGKRLLSFVEKAEVDFFKETPDQF